MCVGYRFNNQECQTPPVGAEAYAACEPIYIEMPGWKQSTIGIREYAALPEKAKVYLAKIQEITETAIDIISTGPDRTETIILKHPFDA